MSQTKPDGRKAEQFGKTTGPALARKIGGKPCEDNSNRFMWKGKYAVMKTANPKNPTIGIVDTMLASTDKPLEIVVAAYRRHLEENVFDLYALDIADFRAISYPSRSKRNSGQQHARWNSIMGRSRDSNANKRHGIPNSVSM